MQKSKKQLLSHCVARSELRNSDHFSGIEERAEKTDLNILPSMEEKDLMREASEDAKESNMWRKLIFAMPGMSLEKQKRNSLPQAIKINQITSKMKKCEEWIKGYGEREYALGRLCC